MGQVRLGGGRIKLFASILTSAFLLNCSADPQANDFGFEEWTITSDFLPEGQRLTAEQVRDVQDRWDLPISGEPAVYASNILGNAAVEGELTIEHLDAKGADVIVTYKQGSGMGATVLNQRLIMLNVPKDVSVKSFRIIYPEPLAVKKSMRRK